MDEDTVGYENGERLRLPTEADGLRGVRDDLRELHDEIAELRDRFPQVTGLIEQQVLHHQVIGQLQQAVQQFAAQHVGAEVHVRATALDLAIKAAAGAAGAGDLNYITELAGGFLRWLRAPITQTQAEPQRADG